MLLKEIFHDFSLKYGNSPMEFEDKISSDGKKSSYELSYQPLCDHAPYLPVVAKKTQDGEVILQEGAHYIIDKEAGVLRWLEVPEGGEDNISVRAFYSKCNVKEFIGHYNMAVRTLQTTFPVTKLLKIEMDEEDISSFRLTDEKIKRIDRILEIYQNEDDREMVPFTMRGELVILNPNKVMGRDYRSPGDYGAFAPSIKPGIRSPFYILGDLRYEEFPETEASLSMNVNFDGNARNQIILLIARFMYESWLHRSWSLTSTVLNLQEIGQVSRIIQSIDMQLFGDLRTNFTPKSLPETVKKEYKAS